jgi:transposase InsO family protein
VGDEKEDKRETDRMTSSLVCNALRMVLFARHRPHDVIAHSDHGSQYCSQEYQRLLNEHSLLCSMSEKGDCYDNAAMEAGITARRLRPFTRNALLRASKPRRTCSNTSRFTTIDNGSTLRWVISARWSSSYDMLLRRVSVIQGQDHSADHRSDGVTVNVKNTKRGAALGKGGPFCFNCYG